MKKKTLTALSAVVTLCLLFACAGCNIRRADATTAQTAYTYDQTTGTDLTVTVDWHDATFLRLTHEDSTVDEANYTCEGSTLTLHKAYLSGLEARTHGFKIVTDVGGAAFTVTVTVFTPSVSIDDLIDGSYYRVELGEGNGLTKLPSADDAPQDSDLQKYLRFKAGNKPLTVDESFTCNYGVDDFYTLRLRPYNDLLRPNSFRDDAGTAFRYDTDEFGTGLVIRNDDYSGTDTLKLKGSAFVLGASYTVSVTYRVTGGRCLLNTYKQGVIEMTAGEGQQTKSGSFTIPTDTTVCWCT